jgi:uncharacterized membrane protein
LFLPFVAIMLIQAAPAEPAPWRAIGAAPLWQAWVYGDAMTFETHGRDRLSVQRPARQESAGGFAYRTDELVITVTHGDCTDSLSHHVFADRVAVEARGVRYQGCGGAARGAATPAPDGPAGGEPLWSLEIADGRLYFGVNDDVVIVPAPAPVVTGGGGTRRYIAPGIEVLLRRDNCELEDERTYADAVTVRAGHWTVEGCGGRVVREAPED